MAEPLAAVGTDAALDQIRALLEEFDSRQLQRLLTFANSIRSEALAALPKELRDDRFIFAWAKYQDYRRRRRLSKLKPDSVEGQWKRLASWGIEAAIESIQQSIDNGWQGLFPPTQRKPTPTVIAPNAERASLLQSRVRRVELAQ